MGVEIVHDEHDLLHLHIVLGEQFLKEVSPVFLGASLAHLKIAFARQRLVSNEEIGTALFLIRVIFSCDLPRLGRLGWVLVLDQILPHLIHADPGY